MAPAQRLRDPGKDRLGRLVYTNKEIQVVLSDMFRRVDAPFVCYREISGRVSLRIGNLPFDKALMQVLRSCDATYRIEGGTYYIIPRTARPSEADGDPADDPRGGVARILSSRAGWISKDDPSQTIIEEFDCYDVDVHQVIAELFKQINGDFSIDRGISGRVSIQVHHRTFEAVLQEILKTNLLTYRIQSGVYEIIKHHPGPIE